MDRVSPEIFRDIIKQSTNVYCVRDYFLYSHIKEIPLPPIAASQVCRSWRAKLLDDHSLWTCIRSEGHPDSIKELLRRSKAAPLHVLVTSPDCDLNDDVAEALDAVFREMHRIRTLLISVNVDDDEGQGMLDQLLPYLKSPAPILQEFSLSALEDWDEDKRFIQTLFSGNAPHLKHISRQVRIGLDSLLRSPLFKNLSSLHLELSFCSPNTWYKLLDLLELSPGLQTLSVTSEETENHDDVVVPSAYSDRRVRLPGLRQLCLGHEVGSSLIANLVLGHLDCPSDTLDFNITLHEYIDDDTRKPLMQFLNRYRLPYLWLDSSSRHMRLFNSYPDHEANKLLEAEYDPSDDLDSLKMFNLSDIKHLDFYMFPRKADKIREHLKLFPKLEILKFRNVDFDLIKILTSNLVMPQPRSPSTSTAQDGLNSNPSLLCPSLNKLILGVHVKLDLQHADMLIKCSKERQQAGFPLSIDLRCERLCLPKKDAKSRLEGEPSIEITRGSDKE